MPVSAPIAAKLTNPFRSTQQLTSSSAGRNRDFALGLRRLRVEPGEEVVGCQVSTAVEKQRVSKAAAGILDLLWFCHHQRDGFCCNVSRKLEAVRWLSCCIEVDSPHCFD